MTVFDKTEPLSETGKRREEKMEREIER